MPYAGKTILGRTAAGLAFNAGFRLLDLVKMTATLMGESQLSIGAWHDNPDPPSRDCGLGQINIDWSRVGTAYEASLRTDSLDEEVWRPVAENNLRACRAKYLERWIRNGEPDIRRFAAWVAYTSGWATFPEWYVWHQVDGVPVGPWVPTGRYLQKAIRAVSNYHLIVEKDWTPDQALRVAKHRREVFGIKGQLLYSDKLGVYWVFPEKPTAPPADGVGPRPVPNNGK